MITGLLAGWLGAAVLAIFRLRPDHRLRDAPPTPPTRRRPRRPFRRPRQPDPSELAGWCDALAREVRSGTSLGASLRSVAPPADGALTEIAHRLARGLPLVDALAIDGTTPDEHAVLTVLAACADHGGPASRPLDQLAATLRRRAADAAERSVHSAQARLSALVMTVLPGAVLVLLLATSPSVRAVSGSPLGAAVVAIGLALNLAGWVWMRRVIAGGPR